MFDMFNVFFINGQTISLLIKYLLDPLYIYQFGSILGVAEITNRSDGLPFDEHDEQLFEVFIYFKPLTTRNKSAADDLNKKS